MKSIIRLQKKLRILFNLAFSFLFVSSSVAQADLNLCQSQFDQKPLFHEVIDVFIAEDFTSLFSSSLQSLLKPNEILSILKLLSKFNPNFLFDHLEQFKISENVLAELLNDLGSDNLITFTEQIKLWKLAQKLNPNLKFALAKYIVTNLKSFENQDPNENFNTNRIIYLVKDVMDLQLSEFERAQIVLILLQKNSKSKYVIDYLDDFAIQDPKAFNILLPFIAANHYDFFNQFLVDRVLAQDENRRKELVAIYLNNFKTHYRSFSHIDETLRKFKITDRNFKVLIYAKNITDQYNDLGWTKPLNLPILSELNGPERRFLARQILQNISLNLFKQKENRDHKIMIILGGTWNLLQNRNEMRALFFERDPLGFIESESGLQLESLSLLDNENESLNSVLRDFAEKNPDLLPKTFVESLWDNVKSNFVSYHLLREYLSQTHPLSKPRVFPSSSLEILSLILGFKFEDFKKYEPHPTLEFYELSLKLKSTLGRPPFENIKIEPELFSNKSKLIDTLELFRNFMISSNQVDQEELAQNRWEKIINSLELKQNGMTSNNIESLIVQLQEQISNQIITH